MATKKAPKAKKTGFARYSKEERSRRARIGGLAAAKAAAKRRKAGKK